MIKKKVRERHLPVESTSITDESPVLAESSLYFINFHQAISAPAMSTDVSLVGVGRSLPFFLI